MNLADIPIHPVKVLPITGGVTRHSLRPRHRHVVAGLHPCGDAYWGASVQWRQRAGSDEQDCRGARHATRPST